MPLLKGSWGQRRSARLRHEAVSCSMGRRNLHVGTSRELAEQYSARRIREAQARTRWETRSRKQEGTQARRSLEAHDGQLCFKNNLWNLNLARLLLLGATEHQEVSGIKVIASHPPPVRCSNQFSSISIFPSLCLCICLSLWLSLWISLCLSTNWVLSYILDMKQILRKIWCLKVSAK